MAQQQHQRQRSNFTFNSKNSRINTQQQGPTNMNDANFAQQTLLFTLGSLEQQIEAFQKQHQIQSANSPKKSYAPIKRQELQKVFKFFKKYEPIYFSQRLVKEIGFKFKKGVYIKKYKEGCYFGEVMEVSFGENSVKKVKHGKGILVYDLFAKNNGQIQRIYEGEWQNDKKQGLGFERFIDGSVYHGNYNNNKPQGRGKFTNSQGQVYEGQWKNGIKQGKGFWQGIKGQNYMGEWKIGKPQGYGVFVSDNGNRYEGQFKNALKHGQGIERFTNGDLYKGFFQNDKPGGYGQYYWKNKSYFKGYFSNGLRTGQGLWKKSPGNSDKYEGQYQNDKKWGYGVFTWANGNVFKGNYEGDLRSGYGQMHWNDGSYYKGEWKNGVQNGKGQLFVVGQGIRIGIFQNNQIVTIQYEEPHGDLENEQNIQALKDSELILHRNPSKTSHISIRSKNSKFSSISKQKTMFNDQKKLNPLNGKASKSSLISENKFAINKLHSSQGLNGKRSVPLKSLIDDTERSRYLSREKTQKPAEFRISQKAVNSHKYNQSLDNSRASKVQKPEKRKNRLLHSSFYLHKFKKMKSPEKELSDQKYFN